MPWNPPKVPPRESGWPFPSQPFRPAVPQPVQPKRAGGW